MNEIEAKIKGERQIMINFRTILATAIAAPLALMASPALAASDYLLELDGIKGESSTTIEIESWSFGATNQSSVGSSGMSSGKRTHKPIRLSSPNLDGGTFEVVAPRDVATGQSSGKSSCATGKHFPRAVLSTRALAYELKEVFISSCAAGGMTFTYKSAVQLDPAAARAGISTSRSNLRNN